MVADPGPVTWPADVPAWLEPWLRWLDCALHREVLRLRARYQLSAGELRGLYVSHEQVDDLVFQRAPDEETNSTFLRLADRKERLFAKAMGMLSPLTTLVDRCGLDHSDLVAVLAALAPEVDVKYHTLFAYLNDDVTRRQPSVDLCTRLTWPVAGPEPDSRAVVTGVLDVERSASAPTWRAASLTLSDVVRRHLLPGDRVPRAWTGQTDSSPPAAWHRAVSIIRKGRGLVLLQAPDRVSAGRAAQQLCQAAGCHLTVIERPEGDLAGWLRNGVLEARLSGSCLFVPDRLLVEPGLVTARFETLMQAVTVLPVCVVLALGPDDCPLPVESVDHELITVDRPGVVERAGLWRKELASGGFCADPADLEEVAGLFRLTAGQIEVASRSALRSAGPGKAALVEAARRVSGTRTGSLAQLVQLTYCWDDLVLPATCLRQLRELTSAIRYRRRVFEEWDYARLGGGYSSLRVLFAGASGTGKTMSAAVVAREVGLELLRIDLSQVVSKYIGETSKNLERVLADAEDGNAILLFDEADALFGRRSEVTDAHDRYANVEVAYLLQRMEAFDGVLILATNLAQNLDEAFNRRLQLQLEFPQPDKEARRRLWSRAIPANAPVADDVDTDFLAGMFDMTGGEIRSAALSAAFLAAHEDSQISMRHVVTALARQRRQQGKLPSASEFRGYLRLVQGEGV